MTPDADVFSATDDRTAQSAGTLRFLWLLLLGTGLLVFELTAQPALAITVACAKFGVEDFLTALWLRRADPNRPRGVACFWFYLANGLWRVTASAFLGMFLFGMVQDWLPQAGRQAAHELVVTTLVGLSAYGMSAAATLIGARRARRWNVRIWLDPTLHQSRQAGTWPPRPGDTNAVDGLLYTTAIMSAILVGGVLIGLFVVPMAALQPPPQPKVVMAVIVVAALVVGGTVRSLALRILRLEPRIAASRPEECWDEITETSPDPESVPATPPPGPVSWS